MICVLINYNMLNILLNYLKIIYIILILFQILLQVFFFVEQNYKYLPIFSIGALRFTITAIIIKASSKYGIKFHGTSSDKKQNSLIL